jgi:glycosyltransferase involved in cell wall biosynthesis
MPVYNAERYVAEAVESILGQTFTDFEFLITDDGSTDRSLSILRRYARQDPRIRLVSRPNTGYAIALNEMLAAARGELVARMDADDIALPRRFELQVGLLQGRDDVDCVGGWHQNIDYAGRFLIESHMPTEHEEMQRLLIKGKCPFSHPSVMMRRSAVTRLGGYREDFMPAEDLDLWLRISEQGRLANVPEVVLKYRVHYQSISQTQLERQIDRAGRALAEACARRGIPFEFDGAPGWRPKDRASRAGFHIKFGWWAFQNGNRWMAVEYGLRAACLNPLGTPAWRLLGCALLKPMRPANND